MAPTLPVTSDRQADSEREVEIACTYRVLVRQHGHLFRLDFGAPCKGVDVDFTYGNCGIRRVNVLDFIPSAHATRVSSSPEGVTPPMVGLRFDVYCL